MSTLSHYDCNAIAREMVASKKEAAKNIIKEVQILVTSEYEKTLPALLTEYAVKRDSLKPWVKYQSGIKLIGSGWNHEPIKLLKSLPSKNNSGFYETVDFQDNETIAKALVLFNRYQDFTEEIKVLETDIANTLKMLKTTKRIQEQFPDAMQYLPKDKKPTTALVVNTQSILERLNKKP